MLVFAAAVSWSAVLLVNVRAGQEQSQTLGKPGRSHRPVRRGHVDVRVVE